MNAGSNGVIFDDLDGP